MKPIFRFSPDRSAAEAADAPSTAPIDAANLAEQVDSDWAVSIGTAILQAAGVPDVDAATVSADLVEADRMNISSHGLMRLGDYVDAIRRGLIDTGGRPSILRESPTASVVDGSAYFGQVVGRIALDWAAAAAKHHGSAVVVTRNTYHVGRVGLFAELATQQGLLALTLVAVGTPGQVAPLNGREGRLGTNPISYGVPTDGDAVVADFATSAMPEGAIRLALNEGRALPPGVLIGADGQPTSDPAALYSDPPGAILPFGGAWAHRGFALNLMVELFAATLAGYEPEDAHRPSNCMFMLVLDPDSFMPAGAFRGLASQAAAFVTSSEPSGEADVQLPGGPELAAQRASGASIPLSKSTLATIRRLAGELGVAY